MSEQRSRKLKILLLSFYFGWLLSFPFYGPVVFSAAPVQSFKGLSLVLIFTFFHAITFFLGAVFLRNVSIYYRLMLISLIITIVFNVMLFFAVDWIWALAMAVMGIFSALYILGWSFIFSLADNMTERIKIMAPAIILSNLILIAFNLLTNIMPSKSILVLTLIPLLLSMFILKEYRKTEVQTWPAGEEGVSWYFLLIVSLFVFVLYINGGFMYRIMLPTLGNDLPFTNYYQFILYIAVLTVIYFYRHRIQYGFLLYLGTILLGMAFVSFALLPKTTGFMMTTGLIEASFALLDLFVWIALGSLAFKYKAPFQFFGLIMAATTGSILLGDIVGEQLLHIGEHNRLVTSVLAAASIFMAFTVMPWLNKRFEATPHAVVQEDEPAALVNAESPFDMLVQHIAPGENLTPRQTEITLLVLQGLTNQDIAGQLFISEHTVKTHLKNICQKFGVNKKRELLYLSSRNISED